MSSMTREIPNRFDFASAQPRIYQLWESGGYFRAVVDPAREPFTIVIPPPNVTGALHLGHALNNTLQDVVIRYKRMQGFETLWMPGTDHAGIATQAVVEKRLREEENLTRHDLGRPQLVQRIWQWKEQYEARIIAQLKNMGCSCDWERIRFTLDDVCAKAVRHTFFSLFRENLIYRGKRMVNWDTQLRTAVSDDEVFNKTVQGHFWHLRYPVIDPQPGEPEFISVATTRPETMLGDTAVAVHPDPAGALDKVAGNLREKLNQVPAAEREEIQNQLERLAHRRHTLLPRLEQLRDMANDGRMVRLPLLDRPIPLVCDTWPKPELGSGCVKITPAHDPNDFEVAQRQDLPIINILMPDGTLNREAGKYAGLTLKQARRQVVDDLQHLELVDEIEDREIELPHSDRSKTPIEPYLANQWFVRMERLAQSAMDAVSGGQVQIFPRRYAKGYLDWLAEKRDWPVSRQLWWGHQIPVWSKQVADETHQQTLLTELRDHVNGTSAAVQVEPGDEHDPAEREKLELPFATIHVCVQQENDPLEKLLENMGFTRVEDVLDTWFSSALWPHSTLGWPDSTPELEFFYPTNTLITSRDIITLWVARMVLMGLHNVGDIPFHDVYIHPKILDGYGETMSKSKGNGIDPLDVIEKFGADALRFGMVYLATDTQDVRLPVQFECPHCEKSIDQTKKNRQLATIQCPACQQSFSTQWAQSEQETALPRGPVLSERFETARNFANKLWNAARFSLINLNGYVPQTIAANELRLEDRWMQSRLATVKQNVSAAIDGYHFADAARELYDFAWDQFCSFYIEMLKDRLSQQADATERGRAQQLLAFNLDQLLRLLHPIMPFITEEIWQQLNELAPQRGLWVTQAAEPVLIKAAWPERIESWQNATIESQFARFQAVLGGLREIRARQNLPPAQPVEFVIRCDPETADLLQPMKSYFESMAAARCRGLGPQVENPKPNATIALQDMEVRVDLTGLIDELAEQKRLQKERDRINNLIQANEKKLANRNFTERAPADVVAKVRDTLQQATEQLKTLETALKELQP